MSSWRPTAPTAERARYQFAIYVQDAVRVLDQLSVERAVWLGTSMGGLISMVAASMAPTRIAAVILNDIGPVLDMAGIRRIAGYVGDVAPHPSWDAAAAAVKATNGLAFPGADDAFWHTMARRTFRTRPDGRLELDYDPAIAGTIDPNAPAADLMALFEALVALPLLVVRGSLSDILSRDGIAAMAARKPDLEVAEVPGVGHAPTLEEPSAWLPIVDFLARVG